MAYCPSKTASRDQESEGSIVVLEDVTVWSAQVFVQVSAADNRRLGTADPAHADAAAAVPPLDSASDMGAACERFPAALP